MRLNRGKSRVVLLAVNHKTDDSRRVKCDGVNRRLEKKAQAGKRVTMKYVGKLQSGKIFDQTKGNATFQFRLGVGEVIKGWDVGVDGMRVGDKRRQGGGLGIVNRRLFLFVISLEKQLC